MPISRYTIIFSRIVAQYDNIIRFWKRDCVGMTKAERQTDRRAGRKEGRKEGRNKEKEASRAALTRIKDYSSRIDIVASENARLGIKKKGRRDREGRKERRKKWNLRMIDVSPMNTNDPARPVNHNE